MRATRPLHFFPEPRPTLDDREKDRRAKWAQRQRRKGIDADPSDAPPGRGVADGSWIEPCPDCNRVFWDLRDDDLERFCAWCAGNVTYMTRRERAIDYNLRRRRTA